MRLAREWERTRAEMITMINLQSEKKITNPKTFLPLLTDEPDKPISEEDMKRRKQAALLGLKKLNEKLIGNGL